MTDQELAVVQTFAERCASATPEEVVTRARELATQWGTLQRRGTLVLAELGLYHRRAADDRAVLEAAGCKTLGEFERTVLHTPHATIGIVSSAYNYFGKLLPPERFVEIGASKIRMATAIVKGKGMSEPQLEAVLQMVQTATNEYSARNRLENGTLAARGETSRASLLIEGAKCDIDELEQNLTDQDAINMAETSDPAKLINRVFIDWRSGN